ncbi:hypothetical protein BJV77DRAFT_1043512, partial [Russula vinacea]
MRRNFLLRWVPIPVQSVRAARAGGSHQGRPRGCGCNPPTNAESSAIRPSSYQSPYHYCATAFMNLMSKDCLHFRVCGCTTDQPLWASCARLSGLMSP